MTPHDVSTSTSTSGGGHQPPGGRPPTAPPPPPSGDGGKMRMNPQNIGFTQKTCNNQGRGYTVRGNIAALQNGSLSPDDPLLPPIKVFQKTSEMDGWTGTKYGFTGYGSNLITGQWYSLNNRRLFAFQQAGITDIPVEVISNLKTLEKQAWQFTTDSWGIDIQLLGDTSC